MRVALLAPPYLPIPPLGYGGTEKIVSLLADGLVEEGHDVTLFASGDSHTKAKLISLFPKNLGLDAISTKSIYLPLLHYRNCLKYQKEFDLIHSHAQYLGLFVMEQASIPVVHTWHGSYYKGEVQEERRMVLASFKDSNFISISNNQRGALPELNYVATVYNSLDVNEYKFNNSPKERLLFVGRINDKKGPMDAIKVAKYLNIPLTMIGQVDVVDQEYFDNVIKPEINTSLITFIQEQMGHNEMSKFYQEALCTLFPISWHEPFGLVMIESMASGTPVIGYNMGSVSEVVSHGKTGFVIDSKMGIDGILEAFKKIKTIKRLDCRIRVETLFSKQKMVKDYVEVYKKLLK